MFRNGADGKCRSPLLRKDSTMVRCKKTYGIDYFAERQITIMMGKASLNVLFSGGASTGYGNTPAQFTTSEPIFQHAIEHCPLFLKGGIKILSVVELEDDPQPHRQGIGETEEERAERMAKVRAAKADVGSKEENTSPTEPVRVDVSCIEDAKQYMMDNYGYSARALKTERNILDVAKRVGVEFVGCKELEE